MTGIVARRGSVDGVVAQRLPGLGLIWIELEAADRARDRSGIGVELAIAADRIRGPDAVRAPTQPVAAACRAFRRELGMDPDAATGSFTLESLIRRRLVDGGFPSRGMISDALTLSVLEFGLPLQAFAAGAIAPPLGIRQAHEGEGSFSTAELVVADSEMALAGLFGDPPDRIAAREGKSMVMAAVIPPGVDETVAVSALERVDGLLGPNG